MMHRFCFHWIVIIFFLCSGVLASDNPIILGVEFPALESEFEPVEGDEVLFAAYPINFDIQFYLSAAGTVDSFDYRPRKRDVYIESISSTLEGLRFYPARIDDVPEPFVLPGHLTFKSKYNRPRAYLHLPFDEPQCALDNQLVEKALGMNGFTLPGIDYFPSYFCGVRPADPDVLDYPGVVYEIEIDSLGNMIDFSELAAIGTECSKLLSNVLLHARFRPAARDGRSFDSRFYLIVRLFDLIKYPTAVWPPDSEAGEVGHFERYRLETRLHMNRVISPPYPRNIPDGIFIYGSVISFKDSVEILVNIDTLGRVRTHKYQYMVSDYFRYAVDDIADKLRFMPAVDLEGKATGFDGRMLLIFDNSKNIRIRLDWLSGDGFAPVG